MTQAWHTAALPLQKHFPKLDSLLILRDADDEANAQGLAGAIVDAFLTMEAKGLPMKVRKREG
jgi:hypothetical protein